MKDQTDLKQYHVEVVMAFSWDLPCHEGILDAVAEGIVDDNETEVSHYVVILGEVVGGHMVRIACQKGVVATSLTQKDVQAERNL
jgi:hypothetical protein